MRRHANTRRSDDAVDVAGALPSGGKNTEELNTEAGTSRFARISPVVRNVQQRAIQREEQREKHRQERAALEEMKVAFPGSNFWFEANLIQTFRKSLNLREQLDYNRGCANIKQIYVCIRQRPLSEREVENRELNILSIPSTKIVLLHEPQVAVDGRKFLNQHEFRFDCVFNESCSNELIYRHAAKPLLENLFAGHKPTCFAYGQTGAGKTHTMSGDSFTNGIYGLASRDIFEMLALPEHAEQELRLHVSFYEIYNGRFYDLLNARAKLKLMEDARRRMKVMGLSERHVECIEDILELLRSASALRTSRSTQANSNSSRSHTVFELLLLRPGRRLPHGKLSIVDLAGTERAAVTASANESTCVETADINKSLLALKECIRAMQRNQTHIPFRYSALTKALRDSFTGRQNRLVMMAMISPGLGCCEDTLNTLRYADRVKELSR